MRGSRICSMVRVGLVLAVCGVGSMPFESRAEAQLATPGPSGVVMGHVHLSVRDLDAQRRFWSAFGGVPAQSGQTPLIRFPGAFVMLSQAQPSGGTVGSVINHIGMQVKDMKEWLPKWQAAGLTMEPMVRPTQVYVMGPDDIRVEVLEEPSIDVPLKFHHVHYFLTSPLDMQAWYSRVFGAVPGKRANFDAADLPGVNLTFSKADAALLPTKGRSLDRVGFEVKNLEQFCKRLETEGVKLDQPYQKMAGSAVATAVLTDPWGTTIELTENLGK